MSLTRSVEVFLWQERTETHRRQVSDGEGGHVDEVRTTQHYDTIWAGKAINSDSFAHPEGHTNPSWEATLDEIEKRTNLPFRGGRFIAKATLRGEPGAEAPGGVSPAKTNADGTTVPGVQEMKVFVPRTA